MLNHRKDYPVSWKDKTLYLSNLTVGIKQAYARWLCRHMLQNAKQIMDGSDYIKYQSDLMANPPTWEGHPSQAVIVSITSSNKPAMIQMNRLLLGPDGESMKDEEIAELIEAKNQEDSDYMLAIKEIYEVSDPKA